ALCAALQAATAAGDYAKALEIQDRLMPLHIAIFAEPGVAGAKYALSRLGRIENSVRSPLVPVTDATAAQIDAALAHAGLI
ncbi:4-hydroxy-tetrahydrodipicolinate synthase, partial [Escherichia coli]|nr:4-hydroxy-tetrahydrodipicolinate synthase [Escherichia coli]